VTNGQTPQERAAAAEREVLELVIRSGQPVVVVDSPPGAGKTRLVEAVTAVAVMQAALRVAVATARAEQSYELIRRLVRNFPGLRVQPLAPEDRPIPQDLQTDPRVLPTANRPADLLAGPMAVVATAAKLQTSVPFFAQLPAFDVLITDEAYQLPYKQMALLQAVSRQMLLVGDPGQLPPLVSVDTSRFDAATSKVHWPAPKEFLRTYGGAIPVVTLPATWRFTQDTVAFLQPGFYPSLPFESATAFEDRRLTFVAAGMADPIDEALDLIAAGASIVTLAAPPKLLAPEQIDEELARLQARVVQRALARGAAWDGAGPLGPSGLGCVDAHVASGAALRRELLSMNISVDASTGVFVETPEIWQGLQRPLMVVKHPLSGLRRIDQFALEPGRACVMISRHQLGCVIVTRAGIAEALDDYQHDSGARPTGAEDAIWAGREAHWTLWRELECRGRIVTVPVGSL
jgi:hypothetical protein